MGSITDALLTNIPVPELLIKIWEFSEHVYENPQTDLSSCDCRHYLDICIDVARALWDNENCIFFDTAMYRFQFCRSDFFLIMNLPSLNQKLFCIEMILRKNGINH